MTGISYTELLRRKNAGTLRIISLLAPARSSSTALERTLLGSPDIDMQVNDPFAIYDDAEREAKTYQYILDRIEAAPRASVNTTVQVKNIADYIPPGAAWLRWRDLCEAHIFLVRNPLLTMTSLFRMLVQHVHPGELDEPARNSGFESGTVLRDALSAADDFSRQDELFQRIFSRDQKIHGDPVMQIPLLEAMDEKVARDAGYASLDKLGQALGDASWPDSLRRLKRDGVDDNPILAKVITRLFAWRITGWEALYQHFNATPGAIVIDSSLFRAAPELAMLSLCEKLGIRYAPDMGVWGANPDKAFNTDYNGDVPYYDRVSRSQKIDPPVEQPLPVTAFPPSFRPHLTGRGGCLEIYLRLLRALDPALLAQFAPSDTLCAIDPVFCAALELAAGKPPPRS